MKFFVTAGWNHAPHLSEAAKEKMMESIPPHLREARMEGKPSLGSGNVYPVPEKEFVIYDRVSLNPNWRRCYGMDVGYCTAVVWMAHDTDADVVYIYDCYKSDPANPKEPELHAAHIKYRDLDNLVIPGAIDPASNIGKRDGKEIIRIYRRNGLKLTEANNDVESGTAEVWSRLNSGRLKVIWNSNTNMWLKEYIKYRRDEHGKIIKQDDHLMDGTKYGIVSGLRMAKAPSMSNRIHRPVQGYRDYGI